MPVKLRPESFGMRSHFERLCKDRSQRTAWPAQVPGAVGVDWPVAVEWTAAAWLSAAQ